VYPAQRIAVSVPADRSGPVGRHSCDPKHVDVDEVAKSAVAAARPPA
jgi:hypothetical protein